LHTTPGTVVPSDPAPDAAFVGYYDRLAVHNQIYAPQVGLTAGLRRGRWSLDATAKLGLGWLHATARIEGATELRSSSGAVQVLSGGVLAAPGYTLAGEDAFVVVPEITLTAGYQVTPWLRAVVGYNFLFVSQVLRPGGLVGGTTPSQVPQLPSSAPGTLFTAPSLQGERFWAQGLTAGLEVRY
jgi:hypothetical protein